MSRRWTEDEDAAVRERPHELEQLAQEMGRTRMAVLLRRRHLLGAIEHKRWTQEEDAAIRERPNELEQLAQEMGRTRMAVWQRRRQLLGAVERKRWTQEEKEAAKAYWQQGKKPKEIAALLHRSVNGVYAQLHELDLWQKQHRKKLEQRLEELNELVQLYYGEKMTLREVASVKGITYQAVAWKMNNMGIPCCHLCSNPVGICIGDVISKTITLFCRLMLDIYRGDRQTQEELVEEHGEIAQAATRAVALLMNKAQRKRRTRKKTHVEGDV